MRYRVRFAAHRSFSALAVGTVLVLASIGRAGGIEAVDASDQSAKGGFPAQMHFVPYTIDDGGHLGTAAEIAGCQVHLAVVSDLDREQSFPCGEPFAPEPGRYRLWLEGDGYISAVQNILNFNGGTSPVPSREHRVGVVPAGRLALDPESTLCESCVLRVVHLTTHLRWGNVFHEFGRRAAGDRASAGIRLPTGAVLAGTYDNSKGEYIALTRPVELSQDQVSFVSPAPPKVGSDLLVIVERPGLVVTLDEVSFLLDEGEDGAQSPDVFIPTSQHVIGVWYGVQGHYVTLEARSDALDLEPAEIPLAEAGVTTYRGRFRERPDLRVTAVLPEGLRDARCQIEVYTAAGRSLIREAFLDSETAETVVEDLPGETLHVKLIADRWPFFEAVDLSDGEDDTVIFAPKPLRVTGQVFLGEDGVLSELSFRQGRGPELAAATTDEDGTYEVELFAKGMYAVTVTPTEHHGEPLTELAQISSDTVLDFHVPDNEFVVRVEDAETNEGIEEAEVRFKNEWANRNMSLSYTTDAQGLVDLPPIRPGLLRLEADAEGYFKSDPVELRVTEENEGRTITLSLRREQEDREIQIQLPGGAPAARAEAVVVRSLHGNAPRLWQGVASEDGRLTLPVVPLPSFLLIRHPDAGFLVFELPGPWERDADVTVSAPVAGQPLALNVVRADGRTANAANVYLWIDSIRRWTSGTSLAWLTWGFTTGTDQGFWVGKNIPAGPVRVAAWHPGNADPVDLSRIEAGAVTATTPWPNPVTVEAVSQ